MSTAGAFSLDQVRCDLEYTNMYTYLGIYGPPIAHGISGPCMCPNSGEGL